MRILLIAGHGDGDSGACGNGYSEADLTREVVSLLAPQLGKLCDVDIADINKNWFEYLKSHTYNFRQYDYVLEVHFNSGGGKGTEIFVTTSENGTGVENAIVDNMAALGFADRGVKRKNWSVISKVKAQGVSAALFEVCFIDSTADIQRYQTRKNEIIDAIVKGIAQGFDFVHKEDLTMAQYEELKKMIEERDRRIDALEKKVNSPEMVYNYVDDNMPQWAREGVQWCVDNGILAGTGDGLNLNGMKLWTCVMLYRVAKYIAKLINVKI